MTIHSAGDSPFFPCLLFFSILLKKCPINTISRYWFTKYVICAHIMHNQPWLNVNVRDFDEEKKNIGNSKTSFLYYFGCCRENQITMGWSKAPRTALVLLSAYTHNKIDTFECIKKFGGIPVRCNHAKQDNKYTVLFSHKKKTTKESKKRLRFESELVLIPNYYKKGTHFYHTNIFFFFAELSLHLRSNCPKLLHWSINISVVNGL